MSSQDAFITLINASAATAMKHKQAALSLIQRTETPRTKSAHIAAQAAAYRAEKAIALFEEALNFPQAARAADMMEAGLVHLDMCEKHLDRVNDLLFGIEGISVA
ncbi:hypothetical protein [Pararhizobium sp.]|uniref:hypothetical protein n=1 Tax=Pararhizobium sp. TaxID=1977563 RepID=UPI003D0F68D3